MKRIVTIFHKYFDARRFYFTRPVKYKIRKDKKNGDYKFIYQNVFCQRRAYI